MLARTVTDLHKHRQNNDNNNNDNNKIIIIIIKNNDNNNNDNNKIIRRPLVAVRGSAPRKLLQKIVVERWGT